MSRIKDVDTTGWYPYEVRKKPDEGRYLIIQRELPVYDVIMHTKYTYGLCRMVDKRSGTVMTSEGNWTSWRSLKNRTVCWMYLDELVKKGVEDEVVHDSV